MTEKRGPGRPRKPKTDKKASNPVDLMSQLYTPIRVVGGKRLYPTADDLAKKVNEYFETVIQKETLPSITSLTSFLEFRSTASIYEYYKYGDDYAEVLDKARLMIEACYVEGMAKNNTSTVGIIFILKNHFGWVDTKEIKNEHTLEVIPREELEQELERGLARIADTREETILVEEIVEQSTDSA